MTASSKLLVLDTNIWLDNYIPWRAGHTQAMRLIDLAFTKSCTLGYAVGCAKDVFYMVTALIKAEAREKGEESAEEAALGAKSCAWAIVDNMAQIATAIGADNSDILTAEKLKTVHNDFEDDMVLAAVRRADADFLVTNDQKLIKHADCSALSAEDMVLYLEAMG